jgi:hypothetical protein
MRPRRPIFSPPRESLSNSCKSRRRCTLRRIPPRRRISLERWCRTT